MVDSQLQEALFDFQRTSGVVATITGNEGSKSGEGEHRRHSGGADGGAGGAGGHHVRGLHREAQDQDTVSP